MIVFPNCKINLGLSVKSRRADGYHDLETVFYPAGWKDIIEIVRSADGEVKVFNTGISIGTPDNICRKAYDLLKERFELPSVHIHLHKAIPMGAGLGGGSADGAFTLTLLNEKFQLRLTTEELLPLALQLGSDCPFFIRNRPVIATGRGEKMQEVDIRLEQYHLLIIYPGIHVSTSEAFAGVNLNTNPASISNIIMQPIEEWKHSLKNDFEKTIFQKHPAIAELKEWFYRHGALYASMSGSGSAVYGFFRDEPSMEGLPSAYITHYSPGKQ